MPYIGRNHIAGDHTSNFKVLDDISSYTATFNGSSATIISTADETIRIPEHRFLQGQRVTYSNGASTTTIAVTVGTDTVGGQSTGVFYFDGVEKPGLYAVKRGFTYIFDQSHATNATFGGSGAHPLMFSTGSGGDHNGHGHYMTGITYKLDGVAKTMAQYVSGFVAATSRTVEWTVPNGAPNTLYYWCHHHTGQGNSFAIGNGDIVGLVNGTAYFVTFDNHNRIKLATSLSNANNNTNINLSSVGSGSAHTLTAAFDGVNKTFKATHSGGLDVNINNSTQLNIAINNVIQKPNNDASYTEGFRVVDHEKIQFQVAPTAVDVFWGTVIANTIETFDISDLKIDNFTGDGSTTDFVLSREVPNNESLMVTLDGVLQHPSDQNVSRAYIVVVPNNIIQFTAAPGNGVEVQVRHLGFAGAATGEVSGFYGRTGNVVLGSGDNIIVGGINATGIITTPQFNVGSNIKLGNAGVITATSFVGSGAALTGIDATSIKDSSGNIKIQAQASGAVYTGIHTFTTLKSTSADFSGSVSIGGTLTYEDVTNIDSVGVITARDNIKVGTGVTIESNGQATFVGVVTFGSGSTTIDNNVVNVGTALTLGHTQGLQFHTQNLHSAGFEVNQINSSGIITATTLKSSNLTANRVVFTTTGGQLEASGNLTYNGTTLASGSPFDINADLDVDGHTNLDNVSIAGVTTSSNKFQVNGLGIGIQPIDHHHIHIESANPRILIRSTGTNAAKILFGDNSSNDPGVIEYAHSSNSMMFNTGNLERLRINSAGVVGINTDASGNGSGAKLVVGGRIQSNAGGYWFAGANGAEDGWHVQDSGGNLVVIESGVAERLRINSSGHVVPGTDSQYDLGLTGTRWRNLYADTLYGNGANLTGIEAFVTGMILLWSGSAGSIPSGFVLCNGSNSTPDLRGRFVVGYHDSNGDYDVGDTGGATTVTLAESQIPSHTHSTNNHNHSFSSSHTHGVSGSVSGSTNTTGNHSHTWQRQDTVINNGYRPWPASNNDCGVSNQNTSSNGNHNHTFSGSFSVTSGAGTASGTTGNANPSTNSAGGGGSHENRPPYYALCYIMKT